MKRTFPLPRCAIGLLLALSLFVLPSLPVFAGSPPAQCQQVTQTITLTGDASASGDGYSWDHSSKTLTLNGLDLSVAGGDGISLPEGSSVVLSGNNTISVSGDDKAAFQTTGALTFSGEGTLAVTASGSAVFSTGTVTVNGGILELPEGGSAVTQTGGMVFTGATGSAKGNITLPFDYTLPASSTLTVESGATLTIPKDTTLTVPEGATLTNSGAILNAGTLTGTVDGTQVLTAYQVTIAKPQNGVLSVSGGGYTVTGMGGYLPEGEITASVTPDQGFQVTKYIWGGTESDSATHQLDADVTVTATLSQSPTAVESVTVEPATLELVVGKTGNLTAKVLPTGAPQTVTWESDTESVATVKDGVVTAVAPGTATITAISTQDGTAKVSCREKV